MREKKRLLELAGNTPEQVKKILSEAKWLELNFNFKEPNIESREKLASLKKAGLSGRYKSQGRTDVISVLMPSDRIKKSNLADWITDNITGEEEDTLQAYPELFEGKLHEANNAKSNVGSKSKFQPNTQARPGKYVLATYNAERRVMNTTVIPGDKADSRLIGIGRKIESTMNNIDYFELIDANGIVVARKKTFSKD